MTITEIEKFKEERIPLEMLNAKRWLVWKREKDKKDPEREKKVPYYVTGHRRQGKLDTPEDSARLATYEQAKKAKGYSGLGFALGYDENTGLHFQGVDFDKSDEFNNQPKIDKLSGYVEKSPSGLGFHGIGLGKPFRSVNKSSDKGVEFYSRGKFFTFTGDVVRNEPLVDLIPFITNVLNETVSDIPRDAVVNRSQLILSQDQLNAIEKALRFIESDCSRDEWLNVGWSLARVENGYELWRDWSLRSPGAIYPVASEKELEDKWNNDIALNAEGRRNVSSIFYEAREKGYIETEVTNSIHELIKKSDSIEAFSKQFEYKEMSFKRLNEPDWVIDGFIGEGITTIAGAAGRGKSSTLVPVCCDIAHLIERTFITPRHRRKIIYLTEDSNQVNRLLFGMFKHNSRTFTNKEQEWNNWFKVIDTFRMPIEAIKYLAEQVVSKEITEQNGKTIPPLVVFDTASASFNLDEENSNSEAADVISAIKTNFWVKQKVPVFISTHTSKANNRQEMIELMSARGAGAWEGDSTGTAYIFEDSNLEGRIFATAKRRFEPTMKEIRVVLSVHKTESINRYGDINSDATYAVAEFMQSDKESRQELKEQNSDQELKKNIQDILYVLSREQEIVVKEDLKIRCKESFGIGQSRFESSYNLLVLENVIIVYNIADPIDRKRLNLNNNSKKFIKLRDNWIPR